MKVAYAQPANGEIYLIGKNEARRIARSLFPDLELLAFQTMHGPKMSRELPYLATFAWTYVRILSIRSEFAAADLRAQFKSHVLPHICKAAQHHKETGVHWPRVVVAVGNEIYQVTCSEGWLFPSLEEVTNEIKKRPERICRFEFDQPAA